MRGSVSALRRALKTAEKGLPSAPGLAQSGLERNTPCEQRWLVPAGSSPLEREVCTEAGRVSSCAFLQSQNGLGWKGLVEVI